MTGLTVLFCIFLYLFIGGRVDRYLLDSGSTKGDEGFAILGGMLWPFVLLGTILYKAVSWPYQLGHGSKKQTMELPEAVVVNDKMAKINRLNKELAETIKSAGDNTELKLQKIEEFARKEMRTILDQDD